MTADLLATLGPSSLNEKTVQACAKLGVGLFRINLSHTSIDDVSTVIRQIQSWTDVPICLDSEGAQIRNRAMLGGAVSFEEGARVKLRFDDLPGDEQTISFSPVGIASKFVVGDTIRVDFNLVAFEVVEVHADHGIGIVRHGGLVGSNKAADIDRQLSLPPISDKDHDGIKIGLELGLRNFALSFANSAADVRMMRELCGEDANLICKIESRSGLTNLLEILDEASAILIDRGDLSRQVAIQKIPFLQRRIISTAKARRTPVYVATNLLENMITSREPTRAEVNDVVSTLEMGADGLVLAAETAIGENPVGAVQMIRSLMDEADRWTPNSTIGDILHG